METSVEIVRVEPCFTAGEQQALAGFLSGYRGLTREAYALDLRQFVNWCCDHHLGLFSRLGGSTSSVSLATSKPRERPGNRSPAFVHDRWPVSLRRRRRTH